jgi:copper transport protein
VSRHLLRPVAAVLLTIAVVATSAAPAFAHARLELATPANGATLAAAPGEVVFRFDEAVDAGPKAVALYDARGRRAVTGHVLRAAGGAEIGVQLPRLANGSYAATYRVVSDDGHPISGGVAFTVGPRRTTFAPGLARLVDRGGSGPVTAAALTASRALGDLAIALALGGLIFVATAWRPAVAERPWPATVAGFDRAAARLLRVAIASGAAATAAGLVLEDATAHGTSFWAAMAAGPASGVLHTTFGIAWYARLVAWVVLATALLGLPHPLRPRSRRPRLAGGAPEADALRLPGGRTLGSGSALVLGLAIGVLAVSPALAGHAHTQSPSALLVPADVVHVLAASAWLGGLAMLLVALPAGTRRLPPGERAALLTGVLVRFSRIALAAVVALAATGTLQAVAEIRDPAAVLTTSFGRAVAAKTLLLAFLIALGAINRRRVVPSLSAMAAAGVSPDSPARLLRRTVRAEVALLLAVLAVTAILTGSAPPAARDAQSTAAAAAVR